jgi:hypothetical protein
MPFFIVGSLFSCLFLGSFCVGKFVYENEFFVVLNPT